jgi:NAD-dependent dihydropyrimidine dehydrogenase PreA subunit
MIKRAREITVNACACRKNRESCDTPLWTCMHLDWLPAGSPREQGMGGGSLRETLSQEKALAVSDEAEESGQVHIPLNTAQAETVCNCCPCCCSVLNPVLFYKKAHTLLEPSRFRAVIDREKCGGCQTCVERCYFDAVEMRKTAGSKKMKAYIVNENCMGCGLCIFKCPEQAMHLELVRPPEHIPNMSRDETVSLNKNSGQPVFWIAPKK